MLVLGPFIVLVVLKLNLARDYVCEQIIRERERERERERKKRAAASSANQPSPQTINLYSLSALCGAPACLNYCLSLSVCLSGVGSAATCRVSAM